MRTARVPLLCSFQVLFLPAYWSFFLQLASTICSRMNFFSLALYSVTYHPGTSPIECSSAVPFLEEEKNQY
ncbi:hypothetical protein V8F33_007380 [Rhypophila sp. PSN 637]